MNIWIEEIKTKPVDMDRSVFMNALIARLNKELYERDCPLKELAADCGLSYEEISQILRRKKKEIRLDTLFKISRGLGIRASQLLADMGG